MRYLVVTSYGTIMLPCNAPETVGEIVKHARVVSRRYNQEKKKWEIIVHEEEVSFDVVGEPQITWPSDVSKILTLEATVLGQEDEINQLRSRLAQYEGQTTSVTDNVTVTKETK